MMALSRRGLAGAAALLAGSGAVAALPSQDASAIHLARSVQREATLFSRVARHDFGVDTPEADAIDEQLDEISDRQCDLVDELVKVPVTTLAGLQAVAAALVAVDDELMNEARSCDNERMVRHLVRSLLALDVAT